MHKPVLFSYYMSSCSWRVRIALALKGLDYRYKAVNLLKKEQILNDYQVKNDQGYVPTLVINGHKFSQSLSILEYLDEQYPNNPPLLPKDCPIKRAHVRRLSLLIAADIQPLQNLSILKAVGKGKKEWAHNVIGKGFSSLEKSLLDTRGCYCFGDSITMADICLAPQVFSAIERFQVDMTPFPVISNIYDALMTHSAFQTSHPYKQPDFPG